MLFFWSLLFPFVLCLEHVYSFFCIMLFSVKFCIQFQLNYVSSLFKLCIQFHLFPLFCLRQFQLNYVSSLFSIPYLVVLNISFVNGQSHWSNFLLICLILCVSYYMHWQLSLKNKWFFVYTKLLRISSCQINKI